MTVARLKRFSALGSSSADQLKAPAKAKAKPALTFGREAFEAWRKLSGTAPLLLRSPPLCCTPLRYMKQHRFPAFGDDELLEDLLHLHLFTSLDSTHVPISYSSSNHGATTRTQRSRSLSRPLQISYVTPRRRRSNNPSHFRTANLHLRRTTRDTEHPGFEELTGIRRAFTVAGDLRLGYYW